MSTGFVGLGSMGAVLAHNLVQSGHDVVTHDLAGPQRSPDGARFVASIADVTAKSDVVVLSLPDGTASEEVTRSIATAPGAVQFVVDTSTVGVTAAERIDRLLSDAGVGYVDAPVSGGIAGAKARTLLVMFAGNDNACAAVEPVIAGLSDRRIRVGERAGLAQAMKLANNFLSATALAATSEAIAFGTSVGLSMATMLEVLNGASGQSNATSEKFPNQVLTERYAAGFANHLMAKDVGLYREEVARAGAPDEVGALVAALWRRFAEAEPGADFTAIYPFVNGGSGPR